MGLWSFNWSSANYICINSFSSPSPNLHWKFPRTCNKTKGFDFFLFDSSEVWQESSFAWTKVLKMFAEKNLGFLCCGAERAYERLLRRRKKLMSGCLDSSRRKSPESNLLRFSQSLLNYFPKVICFWRLCRTQCVQQAWTSKLSTFGAACIELRLHLSGDWTRKVQRLIVQRKSFQTRNSILGRCTDTSEKQKALWPVFFFTP